MRKWIGPAPVEARIASLLILGACAGDIRSDVNSDGGADSATRLTHTDNGDGTTTTTVDAKEEGRWVYIDLESMEEVQPAAPESDSSWDLAFQRFRVKSNGGVSGAGGVEVAVLSEQDFDTLVEAPSTDYIADADDGPDDDGEPDYAFNAGDGWYHYNPTNHTLTPRDIVYVVHSVEGNYFKLQFLGYYDEAGTSGFPQFRWGSVAPPAAASDDTVEVDASDPERWVYLSFAAGSPVSITGAESSTDWDLALRRTQLRTNSGTSGPGLGGARLVQAGATYEVTERSPTFGFVVDEMVPLPGPPGSGEFSGNPVLNDWFDYDSLTHEVSPKGEAYIVRAAAGDYFKVQIMDYADGVFSLRFAPVARDMTVQRSVLEATDPEAWVYFNFRLGEIVTVADASSETGWDLGVSRSRLRTNSGVSGPGLGGAVEAGSELDDIATAPATGYAVDELLPLPGPPGSGEYAGNPVLAGWYDYDPATHAVTPRQAAFVVRTAEGGFAKLAISHYDAGAITIHWAYAGAGQTRF